MKAGLEKVRPIVLRLRFALGFVVVMLCANLWAGGVWQDLPAEAIARWGISHNDLIHGEVQRIVSATFLSRRPQMLMDQVLFSLATIGLYEWWAGSLRTVTMFFFINTLGFVLALFGVIGLWHAQFDTPDLVAMRDVGMSSGGFGLVGAIVSALPRKGLLLFATLCILAAKFFVFPDPIADVTHPITLMLGFALATIYPAPFGPEKGLSR